MIARSSTRIVIELLETEPVGDHPDMLDRVAKNASYLNMARERAAALAEKFRAAGKATAE